MGTEPPRDADLPAYAQSLIAYKAQQLSRKREFSRDDPRDLEQDLRTYLLSRSHLFDPSRASPSTFVDRVISSGIAMMLRDRRRKKRAPSLTAQSLEGTRARSDEEVASLRDMLTEVDLRRRIGTAASDQDRAELIAAVVEAFQLLPQDLQDLCRRLIDGTAASVARELGVSRRQVRNAIERVRRHFEAAGLADS